jgi:hypothetical protein
MRSCCEPSFCIADALARLNAVVTQPAALSAENIMATDNAVSALGKICEHQRDSIDGSQASVSSLL